MSIERNARLANQAMNLVRSQHGVVSRKQLVASGMSKWDIERRVGERSLIPIWNGVYAAGHDVVSRTGRWHAGLLAAGPYALLSHGSASELWGLASPGTTVEVVRPSSLGRLGELPGCSSPVLRRTLVVHRTRNIAAEDATEKNGLRVTSVARTLLDLAASLSQSRVASLLTEAERLRIVSLDDLNRVCSDARGRKGVSKLRSAVESWQEADLETRSELERDFLAGCRTAGIPRPAVNNRVAGFEVDCLWPDSRLVVELDGYRFHRDRSAFERDRLRDISLQRAGYRVARITRRSLSNDRDRTMAQVRDLLDHGPSELRA